MGKPKFVDNRWGMVNINNTINALYIPELRAHMDYLVERSDPYISFRIPRFGNVGLIFKQRFYGLNVTLASFVLHSEWLKTIQNTVP